MLNIHDQAVLQAGLRALHLKTGGEPSQHPHYGHTITRLMRHGGLYTLLDSDVMAARVAPLLSDVKSEPEILETSQQLQAVAERFFYKMCPLPGYKINSALMSFITFPHDGIAYETSPDPNPKIPAVFTFVGQFIDHDLTMNAVNLTLDQTGVTLDNASPIIDLDSVYGLRNVLNNAVSGPPDAPGVPWDIFDKQGQFRLKEVNNASGAVKGHDLNRFPDPKDPSLQQARIIDARNDENQIILQIHILLMRVHNKLISDTLADSLQKLSREEKINHVRAEVVRTWQSLVFHEYLPLIIGTHKRDEIWADIHNTQYGHLKYKPLLDLATGEEILRLPHEFAIGFRFGHSQLRPSYKLNDGPDIPLFNNTFKDGKIDLRGSRELSSEHLIDWDIFYPREVEGDQHHSLKIDGKITPPVFDLPETAVPDDIKFVGNLPHRNLIRSRSIGVVSGEELAEFYGIPAEERLKPGEVVDLKTHPEAEQLFKQDGLFKTPLWYYILKEAEVKSKGEMLGPLGKQLVGEVLIGAIYYDKRWRYDPKQNSAVTNKPEVSFRDLIDFTKS